MMHLAILVVLLDLMDPVFSWPIVEAPKGDMTPEWWDYLMEEARLHPFPRMHSTFPEHTAEENLGLEDREDLVEGDILITDEEDMIRLMSENPRPWPNKIVYFKGNLTADQWKIIAKTISRFERWTCIRFKNPPAGKEDFVFMTSNEYDGCCSQIGYQGKLQYANFASYCWKYGNMAHQIMHTLGFPHEHTRKDRDHRVTIHWDNIRAADRQQFVMQNGRTFGLSYDTYSLMHYGEFTRSKNQRKTMTTTNAETIGHRDYLSWGDVYKMNRFYECDCDNYECGPAPYVKKESHFQIQGEQSQLCLCVAGDGKHLAMDKCEIKVACAWHMMPAAKRAFKLVNVQTGKSIRALGGTEVDLAADAWHASSDWSFTDPYFFDRIKNVGNGHCLDVNEGSTSPGTVVIHYGCTDGHNQNWKAIEVEKDLKYQIKGKESGLCLCVTGDGKHAQTDDCGEVKSCSWFMLAVAEGAFMLISAETSQHLQAVGNDEIQMTANGTNDESAHWWFTSRHSYDQITNVEKVRCMDVNAGANWPGAAVIHWSCNQGDNQKWIVVEARRP